MFLLLLAFSLFVCGGVFTELNDDLICLCVLWEVVDVETKDMIADVNLGNTNHFVLITEL